MVTKENRFNINTDNFIDIINKLADIGIKSKEDIIKHLNLPIRDFMALIKSNKLYFDKSECRYLIKDDAPTIATEKKKDKPDETPQKTTDKIILDKVTYRIPKTLNDTLKLQCIIEDVTATHIIIKALEQYLPQSTKDTIKKIKK